MSRIKFTILIVLLILVLSYLASSFFKDFSAAKIDSKVAIIPLSGEITLDSSSGLFSTSQVASATDFADSLKKAQDDPNIKGVIIEINSPGGGVVASEEMAKSLKQFSKPKVAWIREVGASGAYWTATSADYIIADPLSITGSIGVIGSYLDFSGLMQKYGINYDQLIAGQYKDTGSPYKNLTADEKKLLQSKIDLMHEYFINEVAKNRNMSIYQVRKLADGSFYLGLEAKDNGLIDELGGKTEAINRIKKLANVTDVYIVYYEKKSAFASLFSGAMSYNSYYIGKGIASELNQKANTNFNIRT